MRPWGVGILVLSAVLGNAETAAVLPFTNQTAASSPARANLDWIGESIAETVRDALGSHGIVALDGNDLQDAYRRLGLRERSILTEASVMKIGEILDAEQVVYGSFEFTPEAGGNPESRGSLKVTGRVVDRRRMRLSPEFVETGALEDLATIEAHIAWQTLSLVAPNAAPPESEFRTLRMPIRLDAEENYIRGLLTKDPEQKEKYFTQATRLDSRFTRPCYQLGRIHYDRKEYRQAVQWLLKIGPEDFLYREASFLKGLALFQSGDYPAAQKAFQAIADTVPLGEVWNDLGASESRRNLPQAIDSFRKALEGDQNDPVYHFNLGYALWKKGDFAAAAQRFRSVLDRVPDDEQAAELLDLCLKKQSSRVDSRSSQPRAADARLQNLERLKTNYEERAYWQLKAMVDPAKPAKGAAAPSLEAK